MSAIVRAGVGCSLYFVSFDGESVSSDAVFVPHQSCAHRVEDIEEARALVRAIVGTKTGREFASTPRVVLLGKKRRIKLGATITGKAGT